MMLEQRPDPPKIDNEVIIDGFRVIARSTPLRKEAVWYYVYDESGIVCFGPNWSMICHYRGWWPDENEIARRPGSWPMHPNSQKLEAREVDIRDLETSAASEIKEQADGAQPQPGRKPSQGELF